MTTREFLLSAWDWDPIRISFCAAAVIRYGFICRWKFSRRSVFFFSGLILVFLVLSSPLNVLARGYLFSAHMLQHLLLVLIAPPLFLSGLPDTGTGRTLFERLTPWARIPLVAWLSGVAAMWFWHIPSLCDAAASNQTVHALQTFSLLFLGAFFWQLIVSPHIEERIPPLAGILYLFTACIACTLLGIWIAFAPVSVCPVFMHPADPLGILPMINGWGLTPASDQQFGGLLMWVPACLVYLGAILVLLDRFYRRPEKVGPFSSKETSQK